MDSIINVDTINVDVGTSDVHKSVEVDGLDKAKDTSDTKSRTKLSTKRRREEDSSSDTDTSLSHKTDSVEDTKEILAKLMELTEEMFNNIKHLHTGYSQVKSDVGVVMHKITRINEKLDRYERLIQFHPGNPRLHQIQYENNELR